MNVMLRHGIDIPREKLAEFCRKHHIRRLSLFGSILGDDFGPESDIDMLVEYEPDASVGYFDMAGHEIELSELLGGRKVDLRTPDELSRYFRDDVLAEAEVLAGANHRGPMVHGSHRDLPTSQTPRLAGTRVKMPREEVRMRHMLESAQEAKSWIEGKTFDEFKSNRQLSLACLHQLMIIGEAATNLSPEARKALANQPLHKIIGMRNRVVHGYYNLDQEKIWDTLVNDLPSLIQTLEETLPSD